MRWEPGARSTVRRLRVAFQLPSSDLPSRLAGDASCVGGEQGVGVGLRDEEGSLGLPFIYLCSCALGFAAGAAAVVWGQLRGQDLLRVGAACVWAIFAGPLVGPFELLIAIVIMRGADLWFGVSWLSAGFRFGGGRFLSSASRRSVLRWGLLISVTRRSVLRWQLALVSLECASGSYGGGR